MAVTLKEYIDLLSKIDRRRANGASPESLSPMITEVAKMELSLHHDSGYSWDQMRAAAKAGMREARE